MKNPQELLIACKKAENIIRIARQYFPKSVKNNHKFELETTYAAVLNAIHNSEKE